jgi:ribosomal protein L11 methyltransferase
MPQIRLHVTTDEDAAHTLLDLLEIEFEDDGFAISTTEIDEDAKIWNASVYVDDQTQEDADTRLQKVLSASNFDLEISTEILPDIDWVSHTLEGLTPVETGRFIIHGSHDRDVVKAYQHSVEINAAQAFGTGHHGTTAGCLEMIEATGKKSHDNLRGFSPILDLGTGSGVLAIAAAKLSHAKVLATDIDPIATKTAHHNAKFNQVGHLIDCKTVNGFKSPIFAEKGPFGLIIANILARPLMRMAPDITKNLKPGGTVILSGILSEQRLKVLSAFNREGLGHQQTIWRNGWVTIVLK